MSAVPKLRFPEFDKEWEENTLGDYFEFKNGLNSDKSSYGSGTKFINVLDILSEKPITYKSIIGSVTVTDKEFEKSRVTYGDILFQRSSETREEVGLSNVYLDKDCDSVFGGFVIRGSPKQKIIPEFVNAALKTATVRKDITSRSGGSTRYNIGQESLAKVIFVHPLSLPEQQKIASFLSSVDKKIDLLRQKKDALELYKKGLMQKIFSQEIRFKQDDGSDFPDWEEVALGDVFTERSERGNGDKQLLGVTLSKGVVRASEIDKIDRSSSDLSNYKYVKVGDIAYNSMRMWQGASGASNYNGIVSPAYTVITPLGGNETKFWGYLFKYPEMIKVFERHSQGLTSDTWNLKFKTLSTIKVLRPSGKEQKKISSYFTSIDAKMERLSSQIKQMETFKKGLLQQMFV